MMREWPSEFLDDRTLRFHAATGTRLLSWAEALALWTDDPAFSDAFSSVLAGTPWEAFRWETPSLLERDLDKPFEFVVIASPDLIGPPDPMPFAEHFRRSDGQAIVSFPNLGGDAQLVVPCPLTEDEAYTHLACFIRRAPRSQQRALWHEIGLTMARRVGNRPVWLNTAGSGVAWLHIRLDEQPKYYEYAPYRRLPSGSGT